MVTKDLVIAVDSSTTACKAIAWDQNGQLIAEARSEFDLLSPNPNWYEQRATDWWQAVCNVVQEVVQQVGASRIAALSITHQRESFVPVDENCRPIRNAILWLDTRAKPQLQWLDENLGHDKIQTISGKGPALLQSLPKLVWLAQNEPNILQQSYKIVDTHAYLVYHLTGEWITSLPSADPMGIVDMEKGTWSEALVGAAGIDMSQLVDIALPGDIIGQVTPSAASATGLPAGTPVVAGAGDGQSAGLGANITTQGKAYLNLGTAVVSGAFAEDYVYDKAFRTLCSPVAGAFVPEYVLVSGTFTVSWFVKQFGQDIQTNGLASAEEVFGMAAAKLPPGSLGLMTVPYWNAVMPPFWDEYATGMTIGWTGAHQREHLYRSILEGIAFEHRMSMDAVSQATNQTISEYIVMGGGSRSDLWCQIVADVSKVTVKRASSTEATNLGAAILAAAAAGWYSDVREAANAMTSTTDTFQPDDETHQIYNAMYEEVYVNLYPTLQKYINRLSKLTANI